MDMITFLARLSQFLLFITFQAYGYEYIQFLKSGDISLSRSVADSSSQDLYFSPRRKRRGAADPVCPKLQGQPTRHWSSLAGDRNFNLALVWVGKTSPTQLLLTTLEFGLIFSIRAPSKLYRRKENEKTFRLIQSEINNGDIRKNYGILKSTINPDKVILVSFSYAFFSRETVLYRSIDGASTFERIKLPFQMRTNEPIQFHPTQEDWLIALDNGKNRKYSAWISTDFGRTWKEVKSMVESAKWDTGSQEKSLFVLTKPVFSRFGIPVAGTLWRSKDLGATFEKLVEHVHNFGIQGNFLFVSVNSKDNGKRIVHVSSNGGSIFNPVNVPSIEPERFFSILDMSEGMIFLHVDAKGDSGYGTLYISDGDGITYTKSLERHFYTNEGYTDFYKVESMRGVFITHQLNDTDKTIKSLITFNRGVTWEPIPIPEELCPKNTKSKSSCSLNFHHVYSQVKGLSVQPPLSTETALGLVMLHGHHGDALTGKMDVYLSNDGGYNWERVLIGPHHYAIGDHGNLIVAVSKAHDSTNSLKYSLDRGKCWHDLQFSDDNVTVSGLITEPGSKTRTFSLWGYESESSQSKEWTVITVDFHNVFSRVCHANDLSYWYPHTAKHKDGCLLGLKEEYPRVKEGVYCFHGREYKPAIKKVKCTCTDDDLECNYGFERKAGKCVRNDKIQLKICKDGTEVELEEQSGYRLIPGDQCVGGTYTTTSYVNLGVDCPNNKDDDYGIVGKKTKSVKKPVKKGKHARIALYFVIPLLIIVIGVLLFYVRKHYMTSRGGAFRYSQLKTLADEDESPTSNGFDPRPKGLRPYRDDSDTDAPMLDL